MLYVIAVNQVTGGIPQVLEACDWFVMIRGAALNIISLVFQLDVVICSLVINGLSIFPFLSSIALYLVIFLRYLSINIHCEDFKFLS